MITPKELMEAFARNVSLVKSQTAGLTQEDSLRQLPFRGNCMNWVVGHIAANRDQVLGWLGESPQFGELGTRYKRESEPMIQADQDTLPLPDLLQWLDRSQERIAGGLARISDAELAREVKVGERTSTVAQRLFFLYFHESYHVGQTELYRQLAGKDDKII